MSDTPRTDAAEFTHENGYKEVPADFARTLERELAEAMDKDFRQFKKLQIAVTERDSLRSALEKLRTEIEPLAKQIICPADNTFARQLTLIDAAIANIH